MTLKSYLLLICGGIALSAPAIARNPYQPTIPKPAGMSDRVHSMLNATFQRYDRAVRDVATTAAKTTASAKRVIGAAYYEWGNATPMLIDSAVLRYSGQRSSKFSDYYLNYDFANAPDQPGEVQYQDSYVRFDTMKVFGNSTGITTTLWRTYSPADQVTRQLNANGDEKIYSYLSNNRLSKIVTLSDLGTGMDSAQREFYTYNANGLVFRDSVEIYDSSVMSWMPAFTYEFTTTPNGQVTGLGLYFSMGGSTLPFIRHSYTYAANGRVRLATTELLDMNTGTLQPWMKDSIGYVGNAVVSEDIFSYDETMADYELVFVDRRRLNAKGLADSVSQMSPDGGDAGYYKLAYDADDYPTRVSYQQVGGATQEFELYYYYQLAPISVPGLSATKPLSLAPNPAVSQIRVDARPGARFRVLDMNGRLMMDGTVPSSATIGVEGLTPGLYSIMLNDAAGETFSGKFVKR